MIQESEGAVVSERFLDNFYTLGPNKRQNGKLVQVFAPIMWITFRYKQNVLTSVTCYHSQHFSWLESA